MERDPRRSWGVGAAAAARTVLLLAALACAALAAAQVRVVERDLRVELDPASRTVAVSATLRTAGAGRLDLRLSPLAQGVERATDRGWIAVEGVLASFQGLVDGATVELRYVLPVPPGAEGLALRLAADDGYLLPESEWFPVEADAWLARPTPYRLTLRLPPGLSAVGAGALATAADGATTIVSERPGLPMVAYGRWERTERDAVDLWLTPDLAPAAARLVGLLGPELAAIGRTFHRWFAPPCPTVRLVSVSRRGGWGAPCTLLLEGPTFARLADAAEVDVDTFAFLAHELAHTWWGHGAAPDAPAYGLLVEGTAEYLSALAVEERHGAQAAERLWQAWRDDAVGGHALDRVTPDRPVAYRYAYAKGAWVHRMLEGWIGREAYLGALGRLVRDDPRPTLASYRAALEAAGGVSLAAFFDEWVHGIAYPHYVLEGAAGAWVVRNAGAAGTPPVLVVADGVPDRVAIPPGGRVERTAVRVEVDPQGWVLQAPDAPDARAASAAEAAMQRFLDALASGDGARFAGAFADPGAAVARLAEIAADLRIEDWSFDRVVGAPDATVFAFTLRARLADQRIEGPLDLSVGRDGRLIDVPRVSLRTR